MWTVYVNICKFHVLCYQTIYVCPSFSTVVSSIKRAGSGVDQRHNKKKNIEKTTLTNPRWESRLKFTCYLIIIDLKEGYNEYSKGLE